MAFCVVALTEPSFIFMGLVLCHNTPGKNVTFVSS